MKIIRYSAWAMVALACAAMTWVLLTDSGNQGVMRAANAEIGGPFELRAIDGSSVTDRDLNGRPHALFFGFTHCPEVCPTTLFEASGWLERLGEDAERIGFYFVTVDPERDTPEILTEYMSAFPGVEALTGSAEQIEHVKRAYKVFSRKVPLDEGGYTVDHTATVYLMDENGDFHGTIGWGEDPDTAFRKIERLVKGS